MIHLQEHSRCYSDCSFSYTEKNRTLTFDLSALSDVASLTIGPSFTSKGTKYLHLFNVSLCGHEVTYFKLKSCVTMATVIICMCSSVTGEESCYLHR